MSSFRERWYYWLLPLILITGFLVRYENIMSLSAGHDHAFLIFWSKIVSESNELGLSRDLIHYFLQGNEECAISILLTQQNSLIYAVLFGLYDEPEKITRIIDVIILALWFKVAGYGIIQARILSTLLQLGTVWLTYLLALRISRNQLVSFLSLLLMSFLPMSVLFSRFVSWHVFGAFFFILTVYLIVVGFDKMIREGKYFMFYLSSFLWGIATISNKFVIPFLLPLIAGSYLLVVVQGNLKKKMKLFFLWLWPGALVLLPVLVFLVIRFKDFYQQSIKYDYFFRDYTLYEKVMTQIATWNDVMGAPLMICVVLGIILGLSMVRKNRALSVPLIWLFFQFALFSLISTKTVFRVHLNALPPLVFCASFFLGSSFSWIERKSMAAPKKSFLRVGMINILLLLTLPNSITLCNILKNPYHNPFKYGDYGNYLHPLKAEVELVDHIEKKLPLGSVIFVSSSYIHSMNIQLSDRGKYMFVNLTALYLNRVKEDYKCHLKKFYPGYRETSPHYIVTRYSELTLEYFKNLEPSAQFDLITAIHDYKLFSVELNSSLRI